MIYGIANNAFLRENLVFKGGTVLKKVYFQDYRFSEDLDFTFTPEGGGKDFDIEFIKAAFNELTEWVYAESRISLSIQNETQHETGNFNFYLAYTGPLGGAAANKDIKVDISHDELICNSPEEKQIINIYSDLQERYGILCYPLGEVIAEKMRSIMQRTAARDIYDLWYLFEVEDHIFAFQDKAKHKGFDPNQLIKVIEQKEKIFAKHWKDHLSTQMTEVPNFNDVWRELGKHWRKFQKFIE